MAETERYSERLSALAKRAAASRDSLTEAGRSLHTAADFGRRVQASIRGNIGTWLGSAALAGVVLAKLPARKKKVYVNSQTGKPQTTEKAKGGLLVAALGLAFQLGRPFLQKYLVEQAQQMAHKYLPPDSAKKAPDARRA